jgi:transposase-like protein
MRGKQRYKCRSCGHVFQNSSRTRNNFVLWKAFGEWKQSYKQLSRTYWLSIPSVQKELDQILVKKKN